jgi:hypothetical protein
MALKKCSHTNGKLDTPSIQMGGKVLLACLMGDFTLEGTFFAAWRIPAVC